MRLKPFHQGRLDGLCGVYCVINAARVAIWPAQRLSFNSCTHLFGRLTAELDARSKLCEVMAGGSRPATVSTLLRETDRWLDAAYRTRLRYLRPFNRRLPASAAVLVAVLSRHLSAAHTSAIVGLTGSIDHWTVVKAIRPRTIVLFDSDNMKRLPLASSLKGRGPIQLVASELFLVRCELRRRSTDRTAVRQRR